jgi:predicted metal-dependent hydrolase
VSTKPLNADTFRARIERWRIQLRVKPAQIRIQALNRKWASCSSQGRLTFSRDLMLEPVSFQDYVIVHELLHLRIANHGKLFAATLRVHLGDSRWIGRAPAMAYRE